MKPKTSLVAAAVVAAAAVVVTSPYFKNKSFNDALNGIVFFILFYEFIFLVSGIAGSGCYGFIVYAPFSE